MGKKPVKVDSEEDLIIEKKPDVVVLTQDKIAFLALVADADTYFRNQDFPHATQFYTNALLSEPDNIHLLHSRSLCRVRLGDTKGAEKDADAILKLDVTSTKAHMCKSEALYGMGEFELAMVKIDLTKDIEQLAIFEHGINKCKEAIEKAVEAFDTSKLHKLILQKHKEEGTAAQPNSMKNQRPNRQQLNTAQNLLEELYDDYAYLRELENDPAIKGANDPVLDGYITDSLNYLDGRIEFWRARNPKGLHETTVIDQVAKTKRSPVLRDSKKTRIGAKLPILPNINSARSGIIS